MTADSTPQPIDHEDLSTLIEETRELRETLQQRYVTRERYVRQFYTTITVVMVAIVLLAVGLWRIQALGEQQRQQQCETTNLNQAELIRIVDESLAPGSSTPLPPGTPTWAVQYVEASRAHSAAFAARVHKELKPLNCP